MENYGVQPDVFVENSPEDNLAGRDRELETAVQELIKQLDQKGAPKPTAPRPTTTSGPQGQP
jgi:C-terminal processing protease CtpA/Prc